MKLKHTNLNAKITHYHSLEFVMPLLYDLILRPLLTAVAVAAACSYEPQVQLYFMPHIITKTHIRKGEISNLCY